MYANITSGTTLYDRSGNYNVVIAVAGVDGDCREFIVFVICNGNVDTRMSKATRKLKRDALTFIVVIVSRSGGSGDTCGGAYIKDVNKKCTSLCVHS